MAAMIPMPKGKITAQSLEAQMHLSPQQKPQLQRIVLAGMKVMFDKTSHAMMLKELDGPGTISQKLGMGIAGLMALLMQESKNSLPPNLLIPAGMILLAKAAEFARQTGQDVSDRDIAAGIEVMVTAILQTVGVNPDKLAEMGAGKRKGA